MAVTPTPIYPQALNQTIVTIVNADGTTLKTAFTAGANGSKLEALYVTNTDTNAYTMQIYETISGTDYLIGTASIPLSSGNTTSAPTVNLLSPTGNFGSVLSIDSNGNRYLYLRASAIIKVATTGTVTAAKTVTIISVGEDF
jgi:hypothetical protein